MEDNERHPILRRIDDFLKQWPDAEYGPAHVVLSDHSLSDYSLGFAMGYIHGRYPSRYINGPGATFDDPCIDATYKFLNELHMLSDDDRYIAETGVGHDDHNNKNTNPG